jgi:hypothetical protein
MTKFFKAVSLELEKENRRRAFHMMFVNDKAVEVSKEEAFEFLVGAEYDFLWDDLEKEFNNPERGTIWGCETNKFRDFGVVEAITVVIRASSVKEAETEVRVWNQELNNY